MPRPCRCPRAVQRQGVAGCDRGATRTRASWRRALAVEGHEVKRRRDRQVMAEINAHAPFHRVHVAFRHRPVRHFRQRVGDEATGVIQLRSN